MTYPVIGKSGARKRRVSIEDNAHQVPGLALLPVVRRVDIDDRGDVRVCVRAGDFQTNHAIMRDRHEGVNGVKLAAAIFGVVHAVSSQAHLETQILIITQVTRDAADVLTRDEDAEFAVFDDDLLDDIGDDQSIGFNEFLEDVHDLVKVGTVGTSGSGSAQSNGFKFRKARGIALVGNPEHSLTALNHRGFCRAKTANFFAHASNPFMS